MTTFSFFPVGGCVRDRLLDLRPNDVDVTVVANSPPLNASAFEVFQELQDFLTSQGFTIYLSTPQFLTLRAKRPESFSLGGFDSTRDIDLVLARRDSPTSDGRRPDWVEVGTLADDLSRRDFTVNAMAMDLQGNLIDLFDGQRDLAEHRLRFVGNPMTRVQEDGLRSVRALRFAVTKGLKIDGLTWDVINSVVAAEALQKVSVERTREELIKMFKADTKQSLLLLGSMHKRMLDAMFRDSLRLDATLAL